MEENGARLPAAGRMSGCFSLTHKKGTPALFRELAMADGSGGSAVIRASFAAPSRNGGRRPPPSTAVPRAYPAAKPSPLEPVGGSSPATPGRSNCRPDGGECKIGSPCARPAHPGRTQARRRRSAMRMPAPRASAKPPRHPPRCHRSEQTSFYESPLLDLIRAPLRWRWALWMLTQPPQPARESKKGMIRRFVPSPSWAIQYMEIVLLLFSSYTVPFPIIPCAEYSWNTANHKTYNKYTNKNSFQTFIFAPNRLCYA